MPRTILNSLLHFLCPVQPVWPEQGLDSLGWLGYWTWNVADLSSFQQNAPEYTDAGFTLATLSEGLYRCSAEQRLKSFLRGNKEDFIL